MGYATVGEMINDLASFYNDTDAINYTIPMTQKRRLMHYIQRSLSEIWYYRPWNFRYTSASALTTTNGAITLPYNFGNVGRDGALYETGSRIPWAEVALQEMQQLRLNNGYAGERKFAIGYPAENTQTTLGDGGNLGAYQQYLLLPNPNEDRTFTLIYEVACPRVGWYQGDPEAEPPVDPGWNFTLPIPLPETFHNCLLLGAIAKLQESKGDPRPSYKSEFIAALSKMAAQHVALKSRMQQLPMTVGGMW